MRKVVWFVLCYAKQTHCDWLSESKKVEHNVLFLAAFPAVSVLKKPSV